MTFTALLSGSLPTVAWILGAMVLIAAVEAAIPLRAATRWHRAHLAPNLTLTFITFAVSALFNAALVLALLRVEANGGGLLRMTGLPAWATTPLVVVALDLAFYVAHVAMHHVPRLWAFHRVHHSDPELDVTTTIRQHPGESVIRYVAMGTAAIALGASPQAFAVYRLLSALNGLLEHANLRVPVAADSALARLFSTPNFHKVHHSRAVHEANTNFGNIFSLFDRMFGTFTPSERGTSVAYGLEGFDRPEQQTAAALLALPFTGSESTRLDRIELQT